MTSAKGQSSSCYKGKEIVFDDLAMQDVGEEATHSESECSNEEKARCNPNSECAPLIDPWCNTHAHFLKVPGEYTLPPLGRVWLALCRHNMNIY